MLVGTTNEEKIWNYLYDKLKNPYGVAGIMGNLKAESSFIPNNLQSSYEKKLGYTDASYTAAVDNGTYTRDQFINDKAGYGLAQWTYWSLKQALYDYIKPTGKSIGDLEIQLEFLCHQLSTGYKAVWNTCLNATNILEASNSMLLKFERPASKDTPETQAKREAYGKASFDKYAHKTTETGPAPTATVLSTPTVADAKVRMGHASISENNTIKGTAGDQTGKEVTERKWYNKPWDYIAIHPDPVVREKMALAVEAGCANDKIGYSQDTRNTLNTQAKKVNYDLSKITTACNCDCSAFINCCAVASGAPGITYGSNGWTTSNIKSKLEAAGYKIVTKSEMLTSPSYCVRGAIYVRASAHTACGLDNGINYLKTMAEAGLGNSTTPVAPAQPTETKPVEVITEQKKVTATKAAEFKDPNLKGTYECTASSLNVRNGAGTTHKVLVVIPRGQKVKCYGYYSSLSGTKWLYIQFTYKNIVYTGFASGIYLKKVA